MVAHTNDDPVAHYDLAAAFAFIRMYIDALEPMEPPYYREPTRPVESSTMVQFLNGES